MSLIDGWTQKILGEQLQQQATRWWLFEAVTKVRVAKVGAGQQVGIVAGDSSIL